MSIMQEYTQDCCIKYSRRIAAEFDAGNTQGKVLKSWLDMELLASYFFYKNLCDFLYFYFITVVAVRISFVFYTFRYRTPSFYGFIIVEVEEGVVNSPLDNN